MSATSQSRGCETPESCGVSTACMQDGRVPCIEVPRAHRDELELAGALDAIAASLHTDVDRFACLMVASSMLPRLRNRHAYEETTVFPALRPLPEQHVRDLETDHLEGDWLAQEVTDLLLEIGRGAFVEDAAAAGARLSAFAEALRRHVAKERESLLAAMPHAR